MKDARNRDIVSVVIPTLNAGAGLAELLDGLQRQTTQAGQVLVVDSGSTDDTAALARRCGCKVLSISPDEFDHGTTRNLAVSQTHSRYVVFLTQDAVPADDRMVAELIRPMEADPSIAVCYGRQLPRPGAGPIERLAREFNYPAGPARKRTTDDIKNLGIKTFFCSNSCSAVRRSAFDELGRFKDKVVVNEDMLFAAKAVLNNYAVYYAASAKVYHSHPYRLGWTLRRYLRIGRFFADNRWLLEHGSLGSYGRGMLIWSIGRLLRERLPHYVPALLLEAGLKAAAFKLGWWRGRLCGRAHGRNTGTRPASRP